MQTRLISTAGVLTSHFWKQVLYWKVVLVDEDTNHGD
ncbi:hypothetical protein QE357_004597 [Siphonobacter sp. BAB-5404]|nr:hypothetical protein [Siphonobacter sp. SORGH_AS_0500]